MSDMIERVARAIYARNDWWRVVGAGDDGKGRYADRAGARMRAVEWAELDADEREQRLRDARAAIEAMREPTEGMLAAGNNYDSAGHSWGPIETAPRDGTAFWIWLSDEGFGTMARYTSDDEDGPAWFLPAMDEYASVPGADDHMHTATHWRPLPDPPAT